MGKILSLTESTENAENRSRLPEKGILEQLSRFWRSAVIMQDIERSLEHIRTE
jgi:hypothetical protein